MNLTNHPRSTHVTTDGDHITIRTTPRKSEAILLVMSGCTLEEVGQRFGITRERVRQYLKEAGLTPGARKRFAPSPTNAAELARFVNTARRKSGRKPRIRERMARAVTWLRAFADANGRTPTYRELAVAMNVPHLTNLPLYFGSRWLETSRQRWRRVHLVYRMAGLEVNKLGKPGHRDHGAAANRAASQRLRRMWAGMTPRQRSNYAKRIHRGRAA